MKMFKKDLFAKLYRYSLTLFQVTSFRLQDREIPVVQGSPCNR